MTLPAEGDEWMEGDVPAAETVPVRGLSKRDLASATGYTLSQIDKLCRAGLPARAGASKRAGLRFDLPAVIEWIAEHRVAQQGGDGEPLHVVKRRLAAAQARRVELQNAERERELVPLDEFCSWIGQRHGEFRTRILSIPTQVHGLTDDQRDELEQAVWSALADLSGMTRESFIEPPASAG